MRGMSPWGLTCWRRCPPRTRRRGRRAAGRWGSTSGCDRGNAARCCDGSGPSMTGCPNLTDRRREGGRERKTMVTKTPWRDITHNQSASHWPHNKSFLFHNHVTVTPPCTTSRLQMGGRKWLAQRKKLRLCWSFCAVPTDQIEKKSYFHIPNAGTHKGEIFKKNSP